MQSHQVCTFGVLEDSALIRMIFSDKFVAALAKHTYPVQIEKDNQGWLYPADLGVERIGYRTDLADGKLPTKIDDPAVYDWDGDGHPGATLRLSVPLLPEGELYVVAACLGRVGETQEVSSGHGLESIPANVPSCLGGYLRI